MKKIIFAISLFTFLTLISFVLIKKTYAEESPEAAAKKFNVTFPIAELGGCQNFSACRTYCDDVANREQCVSYAKKKGFYKEEKADSKRQVMVQSAKTELGCDSEQSCRSFCEQESNIQKCAAFAKKNGFESRPQGNPKDQKILQKAKEILNCDSENSCRAVCEQDVNKEKCSEFAKQTGLGGGIKRVGPGGCNSEESCRSYCEKNVDECRKFGGGPPQGFSERKGPGGCNSEESCKAYCEKNSQECGGESRRESQERDNYADYCRENPEKCREFRDQPKEEKSVPPEEFCKRNPEKCQRPPEEQRPPEQFRREESRPPEIKQNEPFRENMPVRQEEFRPSEKRREPPPDFQRPPEGGEIRREGNETIDRQQEVRGVSTSTSLLQKVFQFFFNVSK